MRGRLRRIQCEYNLFLLSDTVSPTELLERGQHELPQPEDLLTGVDIFNEDRPTVSTVGVMGLRAHRCYKDVFLKELLKCVVGLKQWRSKCKAVPVSEFVDESLETFAVLVYINGYYKWKRQHSRRLGNNAVDTVPEASNIQRFNFTGEARGAASYQGWSRSGKVAYNIIIRVIEEQRTVPNTGRELERHLLRDILGTSLGNMSFRKRARDVNSVEVVNKLSKLVDDNGII